MYHSLTFSQEESWVAKNTFDDWHLVPAERPVVKAPVPKTKFEDIPGGNGSIDLSTVLTGYPVFANRQGSWTFYVLNDYKKSETDWAILYSEIMEFLQGKSLRVELEDDPDYYYWGVFALNEWQSPKDYSKVVIDYVIEPYKYSKYEQKLYVELTDNVTWVSRDIYHEDMGTGPITPWVFIESAPIGRGYYGKFVNDRLGIDIEDGPAINGQTYEIDKKRWVMYTQAYDAVSSTYNTMSFKGYGLSNGETVRLKITYRPMRL